MLAAWLCDCVPVLVGVCPHGSGGCVQVVQYTFDEARQGRTPNPDIMCNSRIKFGMFYDYVGKYFANIATGKAKQSKAKQGLARAVNPPASLQCHLVVVTDAIY